MPFELHSGLLNCQRWQHPARLRHLWWVPAARIWIANLHEAHHSGARESSLHQDALRDRAAPTESPRQRKRPLDSSQQQAGVRTPLRHPSLSPPFSPVSGASAALHLEVGLDRLSKALSHEYNHNLERRSCLPLQLPAIPSLIDASALC